MSNLQKREYSLPFKIEAYEISLQQSRKEIMNFVKLSDGLVLGIGADGLIGLIPFVGGFYTAAGGLWLLSQAGRIKASFAEKVLISVLTLADVGIGIVVGPGDIIDFLFRTHAWTGNRLMSHIDTQLALIFRSREKLTQGLDPEFDELENLLFRKGKTKQEQALTYGLITVAIIAVIVGCSMMGN